MVTTLHTQLDLVRDYVNTLDFETGIDRIATADELAMWFSEQGLVDDLVEPTEQELADALAVREAIRELLLVNNGVEADAAAASKTPGLEIVDALSGLDGYHLWHSTRAELLHRLGRNEEAAGAYARALELAPSEAERRFLQARLAASRR